jgi:hypothetical protein
VSSVIAFPRHRTAGVLRPRWLPTRIVDFDGNEAPVAPSLQWVSQFERLRNIIAVSRNVREIWDKGRSRRNRLSDQNRRLRSRIAINQNLRAMQGAPRPQRNRVDEQARRVRNWIAINQLHRAEYPRPTQKMPFTSEVPREQLKLVANSGGFP